MSFGDYLIGAIGLAVVAVALGHAALRLRARLLPGWSGAPARLAEAVLGLSVLTVLLQLLGAISLLGPAALIGASIAIAAGIAAWLPRQGDRRSAEAESPPPVSKLQMAVALGAAAFVAAHWATGLQDVWARGMLTFDTLWYHGPFAARAAETGSIWALHFTDPAYLNWFYPQNSELHHGAGIALFERDLLSPLVNFGWLGIAFLAAWCIGRPYGVAPLSLVAVALVLDTGPMVPREAGTPANDVAPAALLLAAAAILINAWAGRPRMPADIRRGPVAAGAILVCGLALGLALGTKLTVAGAVAAFAVALPLVMPPGARKRALLLLLGGIAATAGFWFLRNLIHSGNPLPWLGEIGPIDLPGPDRGLEGRDNFTVAHYIFDNPDSDVWSSFFLTAIENLFGPVWPAFFALAVAGAVLAIWRPRSPAVRLGGIVAIAGAVAYLFTPLTAAGPEGEPLAFGINLRYLVPALALALALLPLEPRLAPERWRPLLLAGGIAALLATSLYSDSAYIWEEPFASIPAAALIGLVMVGVPVGLALLARRNAVAAAVAGAVVAVAIAAVGWERQDDYLENRYTRSEDFRFQLDEAARWAKPTSDLRIGIAGTSGAYSQYVLYGDELTNHVQYIGRELPAGDFRSLGDGRGSAGDAGTCPRFRRALNEGDYDYVVTTPELDLNDPGTAKPSPERGWIANSDAVREVLQEGRVGIYEITGPVPPDACRTDREGPSPDGEGGTGSGKDGGPGKRSEERQG